MNRNVGIIIAALVFASTGMFLLQNHFPERLDPIVTAMETVVSSPSETPTLVGREVCGQCHQENYHLHSKSGHASTFASTHDSDIAKKFVGKTLDAGEPFGLLKYSADEDGLRAQRVSDPSGKSFPLEYALGSGHNAVTLFSLMSDDAEGTIGIEHCVSWFAEDSHFGLTPGQIDSEKTTNLKSLGSPVRGEAMRACIECHTTSGTIVDQEIVNLVPSVNCEKCHGPGSEHVRQAKLSKKPPPFSVGSKDWNAESELQLCGSCHRLPVDISPKQLREYPGSLARFQPVGMLRSECYLESRGELMCTTCHNPHQSSTAKSKAAYIADCVGCHLENSSDHVTCPVSPRDGCIDCHMPPLRFEQGMVFHDHWIRVRLEE